MTISTTTNKIQYAGDGVATVFAYDFLVPLDSDMTVDIDGAEITSGYTVNGAGNPAGGDVTFDTAPLLDAVITLKRELPITQELDLGAYDAFPAESVEDALDVLTMISQDLQEQVDRVVLAPTGDDGTTDFTLPAYEAGKGWMWDETEKKIVLSNDNLNAVVGYSQTAESAADAAGVSESNAVASAISAAEDAVDTAADAVATSLDAVSCLASESASAISASNASTSEISAGTSENNAASSESRANEWANNPEDVEVTPGNFSAFHWSEKAKDFSGGAPPASDVTFVPTGNIEATDVQAALAEVDAEKALLVHTHVAAAISYTPSGDIEATDVQDAIDELDFEKSSTSHLHTGTYEPSNANIQTHIATTSGNIHQVTANEVSAVPTTTAETGSVKIGNCVSLTQAAYDLLTPVADTLYIIVG